MGTDYDSSEDPFMLFCLRPAWTERKPSVSVTSSSYNWRLAARSALTHGHVFAFATGLLCIRSRWICTRTFDNHRSMSRGTIQHPGVCGRPLRTSCRVCQDIPSSIHTVRSRRLDSHHLLNGAGHQLSAPRHPAWSATDRVRARSAGSKSTYPTVHGSLGQAGSRKVGICACSYSMPLLLSLLVFSLLHSSGSALTRLQCRVRTYAGAARRCIQNLLWACQLSRLTQQPC